MCGAALVLSHESEVHSEGSLRSHWDYLPFFSPGDGWFSGITMSASDATEEAEMQPLNPSGASGASGATDSGTEEKGGSTPSPETAEMPLVVRSTRQRVGFLMEEEEEDEHSELRKKVKREFAKMNGRSSHERLQQQRMSLLGKPLAYRQSKRDAKFRKVQTKIYNFLERPAGWVAIIYHVFVFLLLFLCLIISILATVDTSTKTANGEIIRSSIYITCNHLVFTMELIIVLTLTVECILRIWSAGCRSRYQGHYGRLRFIRRPLCILDIVVVFASVLIIAVGTKNAKFLEPAFRGLRFLQILRMVRLDRRGSTWKLLGSVVWAHRQELLTTWYIGFLALISISFLVYTLEHEANPRDYATLPDALWYGLVTLTTVGYGDKTPESWAGKLSAAILAVLGVSFFALPAGILGSGFALQVQQQQRQKHFARRRHPAAMLIQCLWRCYAADPNSCSMATWKPHLKPVQSPTNNNVQPRSNRHSFRTNNLISRLSIKRSTNSPMLHRNSDRVKKGANGIYDDEDKKMELSTGTYGEQDSIRSRGSHRYHTQHAQEEPVGLTKLTEAHKNAIRAVRKIKYFVARRKFKEAFRPYDVKDVIEQYSSGHADMLARIKSLQARIDNILGKPGQQDRRVKGRGGGDLELFDPNISLLSRVVKVERRVTLIDRKLDMLIELYREERHGKTQESRSEEKDDSHESELDTAPKGFRRRVWSSGTPRPREGTGQRHESTDTSSATSPADITGTVVAHKLKASDPSLMEDDTLEKMDVTISTCPPTDAQAQSGDASGGKTRLGHQTRDAVDEAGSKDEVTATTPTEPKKLSRRWKRPGAVRIRPARSAESVSCPQSGDSVSYSSGRQSSMGSLAPGEGETRI
ncbi:potassium voltage-gated channel subfamily KQT member 4-like isoform X3 [Acanthaster planci]|uniref:Potassium voltage-gated channel subfamily KQT member 4-like isoform X3 n=1 Tax=Acanthaster planci TaxID=133434 RepID=A0A8B7XU42_ACAPL|nr:potassium voltage-gated channel subfamily KQT member 4-like isoform X3 [Acanthaster planci]